MDDESELIPNMYFNCPRCPNKIFVISDLPYVTSGEYPLECYLPSGCGWSGNVPGTSGLVIEDHGYGIA